MIWSIIIYAIWFGSEVFLSVFRRAGDGVKQKSDKGSLALIWTIVIVANFLSYMVSRWISAPIAENPNIRYIGLALIVIGVI